MTSATAGRGRIVGTMPNKLTASEHEEQVALFQRAEVHFGKYPELRLMYAIPNAGGFSGGFKSNVGRVAKLRAEGVKSGVPDICLPVARGGWHGLYIEMKVKPNKATPEQAQWLAALREQGYCTATAYGQDVAWDIIVRYLQGEKD